jgi:hypothetical protein
MGRVQAVCDPITKGVPMEYEAPAIVDYGSIADHTFQTPGGVKGCKVDCHLDNFNEQSANSVSLSP